MKLSEILGDWKSQNSWIDKARNDYKKWNKYIDDKIVPSNQKLPSYVQVIGAIYNKSDKTDIIPIFNDIESLIASLKILASRNISYPINFRSNFRAVLLTNICTDLNTKCCVIFHVV